MSPMSPACPNSEDQAFRPNSPAETFPREPPVRSPAEVADEDHIDRATVSGNEYVEWVSSSFFQAQTLVPCVFECEPLELLEVGPSSVRVINHRFDMPSATNIPPIQESRL